jgi:hypothetical protein
MSRKPKNAEVAAASLVEAAADTRGAKAPRATRSKKTVVQPATPAELVSAEPTTEQVAHEAYLLWLGEGQPEGKDLEHWLVAEQIVRSRLSLLAAAVHTA